MIVKVQQKAIIDCDEDENDGSDHAFHDQDTVDLSSPFLQMFGSKDTLLQITTCNETCIKRVCNESWDSDFGITLGGPLCHTTSGTRYINVINCFTKVMTYD